MNLLATNLGEPCSEVLEVAERGGETHDPDVSGEVDEHLFPDGASVGIVEEVNLVDDHGGEVLELLAAEQHVPKNLGRHHLARCDLVG